MNEIDDPEASLQSVEAGADENWNETPTWLQELEHEIRWDIDYDA